ncbi:MAG TPA: hypothetical protein VFQ35_13945 [Polyangiaceae bacterium]|nr:hypothetical protein [Polyangiaceae bacterium]
MKSIALSASLLLGVACAAAPPRPRVLAELDASRTSAAVLDAEQHAPQAYAKAEDLRRRAEESHPKDPAGSQILAEQALVAYERAVIQARLVRAEGRRGEAEVRVTRADAELSALQKQEQAVRAETDDLELRARVLEEALPVAQSSPATKEREQARLEAARALGLQARLLCASARLLEPARPALAQLTTELNAFSERLSKKGPAPIDDATRLRARCLGELTEVRRPKTLAEPARGSGDTLLAELSNARYAPARDDRGVVVTLRGVFARGATVAPAAEATLQALGRVASAHPEFPILVVLHTARAQTAGLTEQLEAVVGGLKQAGAKQIAAELAGNAAPLVDPSRPSADERNARVEVVFVGPSST